jgi:Tol biopolymer transport system component
MAMQRARGRLIAGAAMALLMAACGSAAETATPTPAPSVTAQDPRPSPIASLSPATPVTGLPFDGTIAYNRNTDPARFQGPYRVFTMPASGGDGRQLLTTEGEQARWSAEGSRLSVVGPGPQGLIFVGFVDRDGSNARWFDSPDATLNLGCGAWSRDGSTFACEAWDDTDSGRTGIYVVGADDGTDLRRVTTAPPNSHDAPCDFTPDGSRIVFVRINIIDEDASELMIVNLDGSGEARLIDDAVSRRCRLSPDGETVLAESSGAILVVSLADPDAGAQPLVVDLPSDTYLGHPAWSPDGTHVAFSASIARAPFDLWIAEANGGPATRLTHTPEIDEELESWGP